MAVSAGSHGQAVHLRQLVAAGAIHLLLPHPQQEGGDQGHGQITCHLDGCRGEVLIRRAGHALVDGEELRETDDAHDGGILDIDDQVVAYLGQDVPQGLGQDHLGHGLPVGHADGLCAFGLAGVNGNDAAADGFGHVSAGVDGNNHKSAQPHTGKTHSIIGKVGQAVVDHNRLEDHRRTAEDFHVDLVDHPDGPQQDPLEDIIVLGKGNGVQNAAQQADQAAHSRAQYRQGNGIPHAVQVQSCVFFPQLGNILTQLHKDIHKEAPFLKRQYAEASPLPHRLQITLRWAGSQQPGPSDR